MRQCLFISGDLTAKLSRHSVHFASRFPGFAEATNSGATKIDSPAAAHNPSRMSDITYPRSPRETMDGWMHLPRYLDKIRLHLAGKLHPDYQPNLGKGFDKEWLEHAGVTHDQLVAVVKNSVSDGEVCDWVRKNVKKNAAEKATHGQSMFEYPKADDTPGQERLKLRKEQGGLAHRVDIKNFVDFIDADEKRS